MELKNIFNKFLNEVSKFIDETNILTLVDNVKKEHKDKNEKSLGDYEIDMLNLLEKSKNYKVQILSLMALVKYESDCVNLVDNAEVCIILLDEFEGYCKNTLLEIGHWWGSQNNLQNTNLYSTNLTNNKAIEKRANKNKTTGSFTDEEIGKLFYFLKLDNVLTNDNNTDSAIFIKGLTGCGIDNMRKYLADGKMTENQQIKIVNKLKEIIMTIEKQKPTDIL